MFSFGKERDPNLIYVNKNELQKVVNFTGLLTYVIDDEKLENASPEEKEIIKITWGEVSQILERWAEIHDIKLWD